MVLHFPTILLHVRHMLHVDVSAIDIGSPDTLGSLLCAQAHQEFLYAIFRFQPSESPTVKRAFARALRAIAVATAELVGPSQWGLRDGSSSVREEAKLALEYFFQVKLIFSSSHERLTRVCTARSSQRIHLTSR